MKLHREGRNTIMIGILFAAAVMGISRMFIPWLWLSVLLMLVAFVLLGLILWFFRIPNRKIEKNDNILLSPADGKVVVIEKTHEPEYFKDERIQVSIFMSPLNVHSNAYPAAGEIVYTKYHKGKYLVAWHPKSSTENERSTVVLKTKNGKEILIRQIAGAVARRICPYSNKGEVVEQGDELGFIKFGSRVDLFLPPDTKILCNINDVSLHSITKIAEI